jgi:hypothetical protein
VTELGIESDGLTTRGKCQKQLEPCSVLRVFSQSYRGTNTGFRKSNSARSTQLFSTVF